MSNIHDILSYTFKDTSLLDAALTHASSGKEYNYERLEFLGDRVLGIIVAEALFRRYPTEPEGDLAKRFSALVQGDFLAKIALKMNLGVFIHFSDAEKIAGGDENANILADVLESLIGAMYIDGGLKPCQTFIEKYWDAYYDTMTAPPRHPKTQLQEWTQSLGLPLPHYEVVEQSGPDHAPIFKIKVSISGRGSAMAEGKSRQTAEKAVARLMIKKLESEQS